MQKAPVKKIVVFSKGSSVMQLVFYDSEGNVINKALGSVRGKQEEREQEVDLKEA